MNLYISAYAENIIFGEIVKLNLKNAISRKYRNPVDDSGNVIFELPPPINMPIQSAFFNDEFGVAASAPQFVVVKHFMKMFNNARTPAN